MAGFAANELEVRLSGFSKLIFGQDITCKQARKFWEPSSPTTQCNGTIGPFNNGVECYICGMPIVRVVRARARSESLGAASGVATTDNGDSDDSDTSNIDGRNPECEHILPIALAVLYLGLYSPIFKNSKWYNKDIVKHEYAWAHRTCNQVKSDRSFIKMNPDHTQFILNIDKINIFLLDLWNVYRSDSAFFKFQLHSKYRNFDDFINDRMNSDSLFIIKFNKILEILNSYESPQLLLLAGAACALNGNVKSKEAVVALREKGDPNRLEQIRQETLRKQEEELKQKKEKIEKIYNDIDNKDLVAKNKDYYIEIMLRLPDSKMDKWIQYIKNDIMIEVINNEINMLPSNDRRQRRLKLEKIKLETKNKNLNEINNIAIIITAESKLVKDAYKFLPPAPIAPKAPIAPRAAAVAANNIIITNNDRKVANILNSLDILYNRNIERKAVSVPSNVNAIVNARYILDKYVGNVGFIRGNNENRRTKALQTHRNQQSAANALIELGTKRTINNMTRSNKNNQTNNINMLNNQNSKIIAKKFNEKNFLQTFQASLKKPRTGPGPGPGPGRGSKRNKTHKRLYNRK